MEVSVITYEQSVLLTGNQWTELSEEKKLEVLQTIENHSAFEAGRIACPVVGKFLYTGSDGIVLGSYDPKTQVIYVNSSQFVSDSRYGKDSEAIVTACLHEGRHAYQHQVADGIISHDNKAEADAWKENLAEGNYISFRDNPRAYYDQPVEADARRFAEEKYAEIAAERQVHDIETYSDHAQKDIFEKQLSDEGIYETQRAASFQETERESQGITIS